MVKKNAIHVKNNLLLLDSEDLLEKTAIRVGSQTWFNWLENHTGFIYTGEIGHFTARSEIRRKIGYWYAYRRRDKKLSKVYLGKSENLTAKRLEQASTYLAGQISIEELLNRNQLVDDPEQTTLPEKRFTTQAGTTGQIEPVSLTKIIAPTLPQDHILRPRLIRRLKTPVAFVFAPSGYGKSTLLNEWRESNNSSTAWVTLDKEDNNPQRFWSMIVTAFQAINPNVGQTWLSLLYTITSADFSKIVVNLTNDIVRLIQESAPEEGISLVLDNYHNIQNQEVHNSLMTLLENTPPKMRIVIASQTRPPLEIGKLRSKGLIVELNADDLRFSLEEGIAFLSQHAPAKKLAYRDMQKLVKRTNGWISGLVLAISALSQEEVNSRFLDSFNGAHPFLREFFNQNILNQMSENLRTFLLETSILEQLCGPLCDEITHRNDSATLLSQLWDDKLFIEYLEEVNQYRYSGLFKEFLYTELLDQFPTDIHNLHLKAAKWYNQNQSPADTIHHYLSCAAWSDAEELIEQQALLELEKSGEGVRLLKWLHQLPETVLFQNKSLLILYIRLSMLFLPPPEVERFLTRVEIYFGASSLSGVGSPMQSILAKVHKLHRLWITNDMPSEELSYREKRETVYQMMDDMVVFRRDYFRDMLLAEKKASIVYETAQSQNHLFAILYAGSACAYLAFSQGHFRRSEMLAHQVLQQALKIGGKLPEAACNALTVLSGIFHERNQNDQAHQLLIRADEINPNPTSSDEPVMIAILRAKIQSAEGDHEAACATIQAIRELNFRHPSSIWVDKDLASYQALFRLQQGDLTSAERLLNEPGKNDLHGFSALARAALLMEQKRNVAAEEVLRDLLNKYPHGFFWMPILRARVMLSIALFEQNKVNQACQVLAEAARMAAPEFFIRPFLVSGTRVVSLLSLVLHTENLNEGTRSFLKGVLTMLGYADGVTDIIPSEEFSALEIATTITTREQEVLRLLNANLSNLEIAEQCSISPSTVKTHLENIYRKLGVNSRAQAISQARILNLV